ALRPGLGQESGSGPVVIRDVSVARAASQRADPVTMIVGDRFAVYENRECGPLDDPADSFDVNGDGDTTDYLLQAVDLTDLHAVPVTIDEIDARDFVGWQKGTFPPFSLYSFSATDSVVAYRIVETAAAGLTRPVDINGNGILGDTIRTGAF